MEIYLVRHGETVWNTVKRLQGSTDIELDEAGREAAGRTGEKLEKVRFDRIYSSPLIRAYETACLLRGHRNIPIIRDERLREISFGVNEGRRAEEILADPDDAFRYFFTQPELYRAPAEGESLEAVCARMAEFMREVIETQAAETERVMIVAYGALNKAILCHVKQHDISHYWDGNLQKNCGIVILRLNESGYQVVDEQCVLYEENAAKGK
ncbi:MAG: histidine phosphatase family protein [Clostridiales bacterium]|nr:histidine phosphatase family protein [Clostridiales bacterium]